MTAVTSPGAVLAGVALSKFRTNEEMRFADGWFLRDWALELRESRPVFGFWLECWRGTDGECDTGDHVAGYVLDGAVTIEQYG